MPPVAWQPWHTAAFLDAQRRRRPVLLLLETAWAPACADAHETVFARPDVQEAIADTAVPIRVDADRRPDIGDRYGLGHWPSVLLLTPEGHVLTGGTRLDATLAPRMRAVAAALEAHPVAWGVPTAMPDASAPVTVVAIPDRGRSAQAEGDALATLAQSVWQARDPRSGALTHAGVPSAGAVLFALAHAMATGEAGWLEAALETLRALDDVMPAIDDTGLVALVRHAPDRPSVTRLEDQADWICAYARALQVEPRAEWRTRLQRLLTGLRGALRRDDGHYRPWTTAPALVLVDASARACIALLAAADALEQPDLAREAVDALEALAPQAYARGAGVAHVIDGRQARGPMLLDDAMLLARALLDADAWRDDPVYRDLAEELLRTTLVRLQDPSGALVDRVATLAGAGRVGRLADPCHPIVGNAEAARLLVRLFPDDEASRDAARRLLVAMTRPAADAGVLGAPIALAWHALGPAGAVAGAW